MACPYFYPLEPRATDADSRTSMLPLGDLWAGVCRALPGKGCQPEESAVRPLCNLGYARGQCPKFPADSADADAVRFTVQRDDGRSLHLYYVLERDHHPLAHGPLEYLLPSAGFVQPPSAAVLQRQAEAYVSSYLRRKR